MGIREALFLPVIAAICLVAPFRPKIGLYGYVWFGLMRPDLLAFAEGKYPYSLALAIATGVGAIRHAPQIAVWVRNPFCRLLLVLQVAVGLSAFLAVRQELSADRYAIYIRMIVVLLLIPLLLTEAADCVHLLLVAGFSLGFVALKFGSFGIVRGGVDLVSGYGDMLADNNFLALALAMLIPLAWHCRAFASSRLARTLWLAIIACAMAGIVMSGSRGGSLSMLLALLLIVSQRGRKLVPVALIAICLAGAIYMVQDRYFKRMETLENVHEEASAESRLIHASTALKMWADYPLLGVGFGGFNYSALAPRYMQQSADEKLANHVVHNSYLQMLVDSGIFAFLSYCGLLFYSILWLGKSAERMKLFGPQLEAIPRAIQGPLLVFVVGSAFYSCQRMDLPYLFLMIAAAWRNSEAKLLARAAVTEVAELESPSEQGTLWEAPAQA
jgi:probable O-glycosylation ligase (exosortase A-associated)